MLRRLAAFAAVLLHVSAAAAAGYAGPTFYVSTTGNDTASGDPSHPFATIARGAEAVRNNVNTATTDGTVSVAPGLYRTGATLTNGDSGSAAHPFTIACSGPKGSCFGQPTVAATSCVVYSGNIYHCHGGSAQPWAVFEGGAALRIARTPNWVFDASYPSSRTPYYLTSNSASTTVLDYGANAVNPASWVAPTRVFVDVWSGGTNRNWYDDTILVSSFNAGAHTLTLAADTGYQLTTGSRFFVAGDLSQLDAQGEWAPDSASPGDFYVWPNTAPPVLEVPVSKYFLKVVGEGASAAHLRARYIVIDGFTFRYTDWTGPESSGTQHGTIDHLPAAVYAENTDHVTLRNSHVTAVGNTGVAVHGYNDAFTIDTVEIDNCGKHGFISDNAFRGTAYEPHELGNVSTNLVWHNVKIHDIGQADGFGSGLVNFNSYAGAYSRGEIYRGPRHLIFAQTVNPTGIEANVFVENNTWDRINAHDGMMDSGDGGLVHMYGLKIGIGTPPVLTVNNFTQMLFTNAFSNPSQLNAGPSPIYMDSRTYRQSFTNVVVTGSQNGIPCIWTNTKPEYTLSNVSCGAYGSDTPPPFDNSAIDYANIGVLSDFPTFPSSPG
jgi:hypothetical protein